MHSIVGELSIFTRQLWMPRRVGVVIHDDTNAGVRVDASIMFRVDASVVGDHHFGATDDRRPNESEPFLGTLFRV